MDKYIKVHGTYPFDGGGWKRVRPLTIEEVVEMVDVSSIVRRDPGTCGLCEGEKKLPTIDEQAYYTCTRCEGSGKQDEYLWLNKGYVVLNLPEETPALTATQAGMMELLAPPQLKGLQRGMQAVYLHDGKYSLIERTMIGPCRKCGAPYMGDAVYDAPAGDDERRCTECGTL
jgi:hypothetical protein